MRLAMDTSTDWPSIALFKDGDIVAELTWSSERNHSMELLPQVDHLLGQAGVGMAGIDAVVVARGPGSFNGLRVGLSAAKGLAMSLGARLIGIGTLEVVAYPYRDLGLPVFAIHPAGRREVAAARFGMSRGRWAKVREEHITTIEELCLGVKVKSLFCGQVSSAIVKEVMERLGRKAVVVEAGGALRRAGYLAQLGEERFRRGDFDDPATIQPLYLRQPPITIRKVK